MFGREFLMVATSADDPRRALRRRRDQQPHRHVGTDGNKVFLRIVSYAMRADSTQPVARAVRCPTSRRSS